MEHYYIGVDVGGTKIAFGLFDKEHRLITRSRIPSDREIDGPKLSALLLRQCDFVAGMPKLRAVILSGSMISDLTPFQNCQNLEFLEVAYCGYLEDISPLASCTSLERLNIAYTKVSDLSPLDQLNLQVLVDARSKTDEAERARFDDLHPDCITQHTGDAKDDQPYGYPWRYEQNGDANEYYALLKEKFDKEKKEAMSKHEESTTEYIIELRRK